MQIVNNKLQKRNPASDTLPKGLRFHPITRNDATLSLNCQQINVTFKMKCALESYFIIFITVKLKFLLSNVSVTS